MEATHYRGKEKRKVCFKTVKFEIGAQEIEYTIEYMLQKGIKVNKKNFAETLDANLVWGKAAFDGLLDGVDERITPEAVELAKRLFPSFY